MKALSFINTIRKKAIVTCSLVLAVLLMLSACGQPSVPGNTDNADQDASDLQDITDQVYRSYLYAQFLVDVDSQEDYYANVKSKIETLYKFVLGYKESYSSSEELYNSDSLFTTRIDFEENPTDYLPYLNHFHLNKVTITNTSELTKEEYENLRIPQYSYEDFSELLKIDVELDMDLGEVTEDTSYVSDILTSGSQDFNVAGKLGGSWYLFYGYPPLEKLADASTPPGE